MHAQDRGLHKDAYERDSCGFGLIASLDDVPSHWLVKTAMASLARHCRSQRRGVLSSDMSITACKGFAGRYYRTHSDGVRQSIDGPRDHARPCATARSPAPEWFEGCADLLSE